MATLAVAIFQEAGREDLWFLSITFNTAPAA